MQQIDQSSIKIFHVKNRGENIDAELKKFISKNIAFFEYYLLVFDELSDDLKWYLDSLQIDYFVPKKLRLKTRAQNSKAIQNFESSVQKQESAPQFAQIFEQKSESAQNPESAQKFESRAALQQNAQKSEGTKIVQRVVRSGESIVNEGDIVIFNRVNSAASINSERNVCVFGECSGDIECNGDYMILSRAHKGKVRFCGENITASMLKYPLNLVTKERGALKITNIFEIIGVKQ